MSLDPRTDDPELLREWYWGDGLLLREIAERLDCSRALISKRFDEFDIPTQGRGPHMDADFALLRDAETLRQRYVEDGERLVDIAEDANCHHIVVGKWLRKHGIEVRTRGFRLGEHHPGYKGGRADEYGPNWYRQRKRALERDDHTCQRCGADEAEARQRFTKGLNVHHIRARTEFMTDGVLDHERANALSNLVTLCHGCHKKVEGVPIEVPA